MCKRSEMWLPHTLSTVIQVRRSQLCSQPLSAHQSSAPELRKARSCARLASATRSASLFSSFSLICKSRSRPAAPRCRCWVQLRTSHDRMFHPPVACSWQNERENGQTHWPALCVILPERSVRVGRTQRRAGYGGLDITKKIRQPAIERSTFLPETELYFELSSLPRNCRRWHHLVTFLTWARGIEAVNSHMLRCTVASLVGACRSGERHVPRHTLTHCSSHGQTTAIDAELRRWCECQRGKPTLDSWTGDLFRLFLSFRSLLLLFLFFDWCFFTPLLCALRSLTPSLRRFLELLLRLLSRLLSLSLPLLLPLLSLPLLHRCH